MFFIKFEDKIENVWGNAENIFNFAQEFLFFGPFQRVEESKSKRHKPLLLLVLFFSKICAVKITTTTKKVDFFNRIALDDKNDVAQKSQNFFSIVGYDQGGRSIDGVGWVKKVLGRPYTEKNTKKAKLIL